jgi:hypothetical protein
MGVLNIFEIHGSDADPIHVAASAISAADSCYSEID